jgi:hypothetical protein
MSLGAYLGDRRTPIINYLHDADAKVDKSIRMSAFKFILHNDKLYRYRRFVAEVDRKLAKVATGERFTKAFVEVVAIGERFTKTTVLCVSRRRKLSTISCWAVFSAVRYGSVYCQKLGSLSWSSLATWTSSSGGRGPGDGCRAFVGKGSTPSSC